MPASPGLPLFPISPDRTNRQQSQQIPTSTTRTSISPIRERDILSASHVRGSSDVQNKVAQFNNLTKEAAQRRKDTEAALKRAVVGREEAESETRRLKEENDILRREIEEGRNRERRVGERLENVMEEFQRAKESQTHAQSVYEKEVRRARKEAFKSSSALVNLQEELKTARNRYTLMRVEADDQRRNATDRELEASIIKKQNGELEQQLEAMQETLQLACEERDALKMRMKEPEAVKSASEGAIALPPSRDGDELVTASPMKSRKRDRESRKHYREHVEENIDVTDIMQVEEVEDLKSELRMEKRMRHKADEEAHLLQIECQYGCCPCQTARKRGSTYQHDYSLTKEIAEMTARIIPQVEDATEDATVLRTSESTFAFGQAENVEPEQNFAKNPAETESCPVGLAIWQVEDSSAVTPMLHTRQISEGLIDPSLKTDSTELSVELPIDPILSSPPPHSHAHPPNSVRPFSPPQQESMPSPTIQNLDLTEIIPSLPFMPRNLPTSAPAANFSSTANDTSDSRMPLGEASPLSPDPPMADPGVEPTTTTSTIPLKGEAFFSPAPATPGGISREEALEQIRLRRGRARSYAAAHRVETPRRGLLGTPRREISAPARRDL